jgi:hypothetical protein
MLNLGCWCGREEVPDLIRYQRAYAGHGLQVIGVGLDDLSRIRNFIRTFGINYPVLVADPPAVRPLPAGDHDRSSFTVVIGVMATFISCRCLSVGLCRLCAAVAQGAAAVPVTPRHPSRPAATRGHGIFLHRGQQMSGCSDGMTAGPGRDPRGRVPRRHDRHDVITQGCLDDRTDITVVQFLDGRLEGRVTAAFLQPAHIAGLLAPARIDAVLAGEHKQAFTGHDPAAHGLGLRTRAENELTDWRSGAPFTFRW